MAVPVTELERQCTYNVTLKRVRTAIVAVEKQGVLHTLSVCIGSLSYQACNAHAPYCQLWPAPLYNIFPHFLINGAIFEKKLVNTKCVFWFYIQLLSVTFLILRRNERDMIIYIYIYWSSCKALFLKWNLNFLDRFSKNPQVVPCERTDGRTDRQTWRS